jgi:hypothetical protein
MKVEKVRLGYQLEPDPLMNFLLKNRESDLVWNKITQGSYLNFKLSPDLFFLSFKKIQNPQRTDDFHEIYGKELAVLRKIM